MRFTLTIECDNAAFTDYDNPGPEIVRIIGEAKRKLKTVPSYMMDDGYESSLFDVNGNEVGRYYFED